MTGLDVVAITDHHRLVTPADRAVLDDLFPERILIPGVEITLSDVLEDSSDAHHCSDVGRHVTWLLEPVTTVDAILEAIRRGDGIPEHRAVR